jgi:2'-5' RNA ligase
MDGDAQARLFVALWPDPAVRRSLRERRDLWQWPRGSTPVRTERLHVTLHFLGSVSVARIPDLRAALEVPFEPFALEFGEPKLWPHGIAVLEPAAIPPELMLLHARLGAALESLGMQLEARAYKPHVTLARRAMKATVPAAVAPVRWEVGGYALMESTSDGYAVLQDFPV